MKVTIQSLVFTKFPHLSVMVFVASKVDNVSYTEQVGHLVSEAAKLAQLTFHKKTLKSHHLISPWVTVQREFGSKARMYHTSVELLLKKVLARNQVVAHNTLTNILRYVTLRHLVPIGVDDVRKVRGNLTFSLAQGHERAHVFARVKRGALFYRDQQGVLGTKLDYWKSARTAVHKNTTKAVFHVLCMPPTTLADSRIIAKEMEDLLTGFCGAKVAGAVLNSRKRSVVLKV